jgi:hypothetical protein
MDMAGAVRFLGDGEVEDRAGAESVLLVRGGEPGCRHADRSGVGRAAERDGDELSGSGGPGPALFDGAFLLPIRFCREIRRVRRCGPVS